MKVLLLQPRDQDDAEYQVRCAWFATRRCRTLKSHDDLWHEVMTTDIEVIARKLWHAVHTEWAIDLLRQSWFQFDLEEVPAWLFTEMWNHQFLAREFPKEQLSQRSIPSWQFSFSNPFPARTDLHIKWVEIEADIKRLMHEATAAGYSKDDIRNLAPQGLLSNAVVGCNAETLHHVTYMRGSQELAGQFGGHAAPLFQELVEQMWSQARERCPWLFFELLAK